MIIHDINIGKEERSILLDLTLNSKTVKKELKAIKIYFFVLAALCILCCILFRDIFWFFAPLGLCCLIAGIFSKNLVVSKYKKAYRRVDPMVTSGKRHYEIDETGIEIHSEIGITKTKWNGFCNYGTNHHYYWIWRRDNHVILIDKDKLNVMETRELEQYLKKIKGE